MQALHNPNTDCTGRYLVIESLFKLLNNVFDGSLESIETDRPFFTGLDHAAKQLLPVKRFVTSVAFDHPKIASLDLFVSCEPMKAPKAFPSASNGRSAFCRARIDDLVF